jgi:hypothetical protein
LTTGSARTRERIERKRRKEGVKEGGSEGGKEVEGLRGEEGGPPSRRGGERSYTPAIKDMITP